MTELTAAVTALARGLKEKALLPLASTATEFALLRRGGQLMVSCYGTESAPDVHLLNRAVSLDALLAACGEATREAANAEADPVAQQIAERIAERAERTEISEVSGEPAPAVRRRGGAAEPTGDLGPLTFGFEASIYPSALPGSARSSRADVHALLFEGSLWAFVRGRRVSLARGPIMLAVQRMVVAVRALIEARDAGRALHLRLRAGGFHVQVRSTAGGEVAITLGGESHSHVTANALTVAEACSPILRVASDLLRTLIGVDRGQGRNLRVRALREEVRTLRRAVGGRRRAQSFVNLDPDRLRLDMPSGADTELVPRASHDPSPALRFGERWRIAVDGLDAGSTYLCGDRLVVATAEHTVALSRDRGEVLWAREGVGITTFMAGATLLRLSMDGQLELCDVADGEPYAVSRVAPRMGGACVGLSATGPNLPPMAVLGDGSHRLVAIDLRTGEPRWRFTSRSGGAFGLEKVGRILLVSCGDGSVHALDLATGEDLWQHAQDTRFPHAPVVTQDTVLAVSAGGDDGVGALYGIDLFTGQSRFRVPLDDAATAAPIAVGERILVPTAGSDRGELRAYDAASGELRWRAPDPGVGEGGAALHVDQTLVVNTPSGHLSATEIATGALRWSQRIADPSTDELPRRLAPVLRAGALFAPAASVHIIRPRDGARLGATLPCDLVPDVLRVDERGWVYVAEESGHIAAYAPVPHLALVRGGG